MSYYNEDKDLIISLKSGDKEAGERIFRKYFFIAENIATNRFHNTSYDYPLILRICTKSLTEAINKYSLYDGEVKLFITSYISNKINNFLATNQVPIIPAFDNNDATIKIINAFRIKATIQDYLDVRCAIETFPVKVKRCIFLLYVKGIEIKEVAKILNSDADNINQAMEKVKMILVKQFGKAEGKREKFPTMLMDHFSGYSFEQVKEAIYKLPDKQKAQLYSIYGNGLDEYNEPSRTSKENFKKTIAKNIVKLINGEELYVGRRTGGRKKDLEKVFPGRTMNEIKLAISHLPASEQSLVYKKYGMELTENNNISKKEKNKMIAIKRHLSLVLSGTEIMVKRKDKTLIDRFPNVSKEKLMEAVSNLSLSEQEIVYSMFGKNLDEYHKTNTRDYHRFAYTIKKHLDLILVGEKESRRLRQGKTLIDRFPNVSREKLMEAVSNLSLPEQEIIYSIFGKNLDEYHKVNSKDYHKFASTIKKHLDLILVGEKVSNKRQGKTLIDRFPNVSKEKLMEAVSSLSLSDQKIIFSMFGENLDEYHTIKSVEKNRFMMTIKKSLASIIETKMGTTVNINSEYIKPKELIILPRRTEDSSSNSISLTNDKGTINLDLDKIAQYFKIMIETKTFSKEELLIAFLRVLMMDDIISMDDICNYFIKTPEDVNNITYKIIASLESNFLELFENIKEKINNSNRELH